MAAADSDGALAPVCVLQLNYAINGYFYGLAQPFLRSRFRFELPDTVDWRPIDAALMAISPGADNHGPGFSAAPVAGAVDRIVHWTGELQRRVAYPVFETGRILRGAHSDPATVSLALPTIDHTIAILAQTAVIGVINRGVAGALSGAELAKAAQPDIDALTKTAERHGLRAPNMIRFLEAAHKRGIPWFHLGGSAFQIGHGARSRWFDSSFTDATSMIGATSHAIRWSPPRSCGRPDCRRRTIRP